MSALVDAIRDILSKIDSGDNAKKPLVELLTDSKLQPCWEMGPPFPAPDIGKREQTAIKRMVDWFQVNFEDPTIGTPRDDGEYVFLWGMAVSAEDQLVDVFGTQLASAFGDEAADRVAAAVEQIEEDGIYEWVPSGLRMQPVNRPNELVAAKQKLGVVLEGLDDKTTKAEFNVRALALVLRELDQAQRKLSLSSARSTRTNVQP